MEEYELLEGFKDDVRSLHPQVKIAQISLKIANIFKDSTSNKGKTDCHSNRHEERS